MRLLAAILALACLDVPAAAQTVFRAALNGGQVVPATNTNATGLSLMHLDPVTRQVKYDLSVANLPGTFQAAEVRSGIPGQNGAVVFTLAGQPPVLSGTSAALTAAQAEALQKSQLHVQVRTTTFPNGAIRGQLTPGYADFDSRPNGFNIVPAPVNTPGSATGSFTLNGNETLTYSVAAQGLLGVPTVCHIADGAAGANGPVQFTLTNVANNQWAGTTAQLTQPQIAKLQSGLLYLVIRTNAFPAGEVRDQIWPTYLKYGAGCPSSTGATDLSGSGAPWVGETITLRVTGAKKNATGILFLSVVGIQAKMAGTCYLRVGVNPPFPIPLPTDAQGTATLQAPIPQSLPLLWMQAQFLGADNAVPAKMYATNGLSVNVH